MICCIFTCVIFNKWLGWRIFYFRSLKSRSSFQVISNLIWIKMMSSNDPSWLLLRLLFLRHFCLLFRKRNPLKLKIKIRIMPWFHITHIRIPYFGSFHRCDQLSLIFYIDSLRCKPQSLTWFSALPKLNVQNSISRLWKFPSVLQNWFWVQTCFLGDKWWIHAVLNHVKRSKCLFEKSILLSLMNSYDPAH